MESSKVRVNGGETKFATPTIPESTKAHGDSISNKPGQTEATPGGVVVGGKDTVNGTTARSADPTATNIGTSKSSKTDLQDVIPTSVEVDGAAPGGGEVDKEEAGRGQLTESKHLYQGEEDNQGVSTHLPHWLWKTDRNLRDLPGRTSIQRIWQRLPRTRKPPNLQFWFATRSRLTAARSSRSTVL